MEKQRSVSEWRCLCRDKDREPGDGLIVGRLKESDLVVLPMVR